jgi:hypothetical protein
MNKLFLIIGILVISGCASEYVPPAQQFPTKPAGWDRTPCKLLPPSADTDEDLTIDVQNDECARQLRLKVFRLQDWIRNVTQ